MMRIKNKDYIIAISLVIFHFIMWYYFAYIKFAGVSVEDYKYILGLPEWFFYSCIVSSCIIIIWVIISVNIIFNKEISEEEK